METRLNFINKTENTRNARYVLFKKNLAADNQDTVAVLRFFDTMGFDDCESFTVKDEYWVAGWWTDFKKGEMFSRSYLAEPVQAVPGEKFALSLFMDERNMDITISQDGYAGDIKDIELTYNSNGKESIHGQIYQGRRVGSATLRDGEMVPTSYQAEGLLASTPMKKGQGAAFRFDSSIYMGVTWKHADIHHPPGSHLLPAKDIHHVTEIPLLGISFAEIIASGGGPDKQKPVVNFGLDSVMRPRDVVPQDNY